MVLQTAALWMLLSMVFEFFCVYVGSYAAEIFKISEKINMYIFFQLKVIMLFMITSFLWIFLFVGSSEDDSSQTVEDGETPSACKRSYVESSFNEHNLNSAPLKRLRKGPPRVCRQP